MAPRLTLATSASLAKQPPVMMHAISKPDTGTVVITPWLQQPTLCRHPPASQFGIAPPNWSKKWELGLQVVKVISWPARQADGWPTGRQPTKVAQLQPCRPSTRAKMEQANPYCNILNFNFCYDLFRLIDEGSSKHASAVEQPPTPHQVLDFQFQSAQIPVMLSPTEKIFSINI